MRSRRPLVLMSVTAVLAVVAATWGSPPTSGERLAGRPHQLAAPPDHLIVVIEENHSF